MKCSFQAGRPESQRRNRPPQQHCEIRQECYRQANRRPVSRRWRARESKGPKVESEGEKWRAVRGPERVQQAPAFEPRSSSLVDIVAIHHIAREGRLIDQQHGGIERFGDTFYCGDKVMQTENDYEKDVFNGDLGVISAIDPEAQLSDNQIAVRAMRQHIQQLVKDYETAQAESSILIPDLD